METEVICEVNGVPVFVREDGVLKAPEGLPGLAAYFEARGTPEWQQDRLEAWRSAALQARDDLRAIEEAFAEATPVGEDGPNPPIGPGQTFAVWTSPALTMRSIDEMEGGGERHGE